MEIKTISSEGLKHQFEVTVPADEIRTEVDAKLAELGKRIKMPGFRPGKVPLNLLRKQYGKNVMGEVLQELVNSSAQKAINDNELKPAMEPDIEITSFEEDQDLAYSLTVETLPEIEPVDFSEIEIERLVTKVTDVEVEEALGRIAEQHGVTEAIKSKRAAKDGDFAVIDFVGRLDGVEFEGGKGEDVELQLGAGRFLPEFEEAVLGMQPGESKTFDVNFPEGYPAENLAGKTAQFEATLKELKEPVPAAVDEELAKKTGFDSLDALREDVRQRIQEQYDMISRNRAKRQLLDRLADLHDFSVPEGMVDSEFEQIWQQVEQSRAQEGENAGEEEDEEKQRQEYRDIAERRVRLGLLLSEIGNRNEIQVTQDEVNQAMIREVQRYPGQEQQILEYFQKNPQAQAQLRMPIFEDKAIDFILEMTKVSEKEVPAEELMRDPDEEEDAEAEAEAPKTGSKGKSGSGAKKKPAAKKKTAAKSKAKKETDEG
jgi:trigger factor